MTERPDGPLDRTEFIDHLDAVGRAYAAMLSAHRGTSQEVGWSDPDLVETRHRVMTADMRPGPGSRVVRVLDFGCGTGSLLGLIDRERLWPYLYTGVDVCQDMIAEASLRYGKVIAAGRARFMTLDRFDGGDEEFDHCVCSGVFTVRHGLGPRASLDLMARTLMSLWCRCRVGLSFNVFSPFLRPDNPEVMHVPLDRLLTLVESMTSFWRLYNDYKREEVCFHLSRSVRNE